MKRSIPYALILLIAFVLANAVFFLDEGLYSFDYWKEPGEVIILFLLSLIIAIPPVVIQSRIKSKNPGLVALGYAPWILLVLVLL
ncbi:hypothetical protein [Aureitalea marina]|uniref:Uncharacterized protein n=1 Tax=Aureitalea marina TaxID=930804 RepID=A0A2S7KN62_9FLAO|nr:hypothetical protein [Aureitalea marina]PQB04038.1 hypothetical protein BST85_03320 [Aureitalea marina]